MKKVLIYCGTAEQYENWLLENSVNGFLYVRVLRAADANLPPSAVERVVRIYDGTTDSLDSSVLPLLWRLRDQGVEFTQVEL